MIVLQQGRSRKDSLVPIRRAEMDSSDLKIEIVDMSMLNGVELVTMDTDQMFEVVSTGSNSPRTMSPCMSPSSVSNDRSASPTPSETTPRPRKRAKLDHLSQEEKAQHRKMMNRISAQSARDRQKAYMNQQEKQIKELTQQVEGLKTENKKLKSNSEKLVEENASLRDMLDKLQDQLRNMVQLPSDHVAAHVKVEPAPEQQVDESCTSFEPAEGITSTADVGFAVSDDGALPIDLDSTEVIEALEAFSRAILEQEGFSNAVDGSAVESSNGKDDAVAASELCSNEGGRAGLGSPSPLQSFSTAVPIVFDQNQMTLDDDDALSSTSEVALPTEEAVFGELPNPVSPASITNVQLNATPSYSFVNTVIKVEKNNFDAFTDSELGIYDSWSDVHLFPDLGLDI